MKLDSGVKNIIFDLGAVLLNIDLSLTVKAFDKIGLKDFDKIYLQSGNKKLFDDFEKGKISSDTFFKTINTFADTSFRHNLLITAWNALLLDFPKERLKLLEKLKKKYRLFLLSNTNETHIAEYSNILHRTFGYGHLQHIFEKEYYSFNMGMRKPDSEIFDFVVLENKLDPVETLFIDDSLLNIEGAAKAGIQVFHLQHPQTILDIKFLY